MLDFYLSVNNSEEVVHIPVTPPSFSVTNSQSTETFESAGYGWIKIIGNTELRGVHGTEHFLSMTIRSDVMRQWTVKNTTKN